MVNGTPEVVLINRRGDKKIKKVKMRRNYVSFMILLCI